MLALGAAAPRFLAASATLGNPAAHLVALTGQPFVTVGEDDDTAARHLRRIHFIRPVNASVHTLLRELMRTSTGQFVAFPQSRQQTELIAAIANRPDRAETTATEESSENALTPEVLEQLKVRAFRGGFSPAERDEIQQAFIDKKIRGLVATSAFEVGIDLPGLNVGFLVGLPDSPASFWQRLGRFGRHGDADVYLIHDARPLTDTFFEQPAALLEWRAKDAALYPDNAIIAANNALCLEHEMASFAALPVRSQADAILPPLLRELVSALQRGEPTSELREAQAKVANTTPPHLAFPLRACEQTFHFEGVNGGLSPEGEITYAQVLREAAPGMVYFHAGQPWRVLGIDGRRRMVRAVREKHYHTKARTIPAVLRPDFSRPALSDQLVSSTGLRIIEGHVRVTETLLGFEECRGRMKNVHNYGDGSFGQRGPLFRSFESTAVLFFHPNLGNYTAGQQTVVAGLLREALLALCPRESSELAATSGDLRVARRDLVAGERFLAVYDTIPGSLRLSAAIQQEGLRQRILERAAVLAHQRYADDTETAPIAKLARLLADASQGASSPLPLEWAAAASTAPEVFAPGSIALAIRSQLTVTIRGVLVDLEGNISYEVERLDDPAFKGLLPAASVTEIPGQSRFVALAQALAA